MTGMNPISTGISPQSPAASSDSRLKALEQKLAQLKTEKEKAVRNHNKDKVKELEKEIQKVEQQIEQLKQKEKKKGKEQKKDGDRESAYGQMVPDPRLGNLVDRGVVLKEGMTLRDLYNERVPCYEKYADITIDETGQTAGETVDHLRRLIEKRFDS